MNKSLIYIVCLISVLGCSKLPEPSEEIIDRQMWYESMIVRKIDFVQKQGNELYFDLYVPACKNGKTGFYYPDSCFEEVYFNNGNITFSPDSIWQQETHKNESYQTIVLIDETALAFKEYSGPPFVDALNRLNKECREELGQYFGLGYFARDEVNGNSPVYFLKGEESQSIFDHNEQEVMRSVVSNYSQLGQAQSSSLYDAIDKALDILINEKKSIHQSVTVIFNALDDGSSSITMNNLILKAQQNNIKINLIGYDNATYEHFRLAHATKGFITYANIISILSPIYHIHDLLAENLNEYVIRCKCTRTANWSVGVSVYGYLDAFYYEEIDGQYFEDDLYDDLDIDQFLPIYLKVE